MLLGANASGLQGTFVMQRKVWGTVDLGLKLKLKLMKKVGLKEKQL